MFVLKLSSACSPWRRFLPRQNAHALKPPFPPLRCDLVIPCFLRIRPGSTAWKEERFSQLQEVLWDELDLQERYDELQRKLGYVNETIRYSLDVAKDAKGIFLERLIVILIAAELALSLANTGLLGHVADAAGQTVAAVGDEFATTQSRT